MSLTEARATRRQPRKITLANGHQGKARSKGWELAGSCLKRTAAALVIVAGLLCGELRAANAPKIDVAVIGDLEKPTKDATVPPSPHYWKSDTSTVTISGGLNETVAFQIVLSSHERVEGVNLTFSDLVGPSTIPAANYVSPSLEFYQFVATGKYTWGPPSEVLPDKKWYPEVLIPFTNPYSGTHEPVGAPFTMDPTNGPAQGVWVDVFIPKSAGPGLYRGTATITAPGFSKLLKIELTVRDFTVPDKTHVDGYGDMNGYDLEGRKCSDDLDAWWRLAKRYHQMAHQHRITICEEWYATPPRGLRASQWKPGMPVISRQGWRDFDQTIGTILDGSIFTEAQGYVGPGEHTPPRFWRAPYEQNMNGRIKPLAPGFIDWASTVAKETAEHYHERGWDGIRLFAYILDETEGGIDKTSSGGQGASDENRQYIAMDHQQMRLLQQALDGGAGQGRINLMWTSHTDPAAFADDPRTDLTSIIHWWAPNGSAANPTYLAPMIARGDTAWFYHDGHPAVGVHVVNANGVELAAWPMIDWRYGLTGSFWWSMNAWDRNDPLRVAQYSPGEDRWGNGILFYPGLKLHTIGYKDIEGPLASVRMNAYRHGLQDYEYCWLMTANGHKAEVDAMVKALIPVALSEAASCGPKAPWNTDPNAWYAFREKVGAALELAKK